MNLSASFERLVGASRHLQSPAVTAQTGNTFEVPFGQISLAASSVGAGPTVIVVQDWNGLLEDMDSIAQALATHGYRAVRFTPPDPSNESHVVADLSLLSDAITVVAHAVGPISAIVAHGTGATAAMLSLARQPSTTNLVLIGADPLHGSTEIAAELGDIRSLLIHSSDDSVATLHDMLGVARAWPNCMLERVEKLGHRQLLFSAQTISSVLRFLDGAPDTVH